MRSRVSIGRLKGDEGCQGYRRSLGYVAGSGKSTNSFQNLEV